MCLQYKSLFDRYAALTPRPMSGYHFSSIVGWDAHFHFTFEIIGAYLCIFAFQGKDSFLYLPPLGPGLDVEVVAECFKRMGQRPIARIENIMDYQLPALKAAGYNVYEKACEYVYHSKDLQELRGTRYKSVRHDVNLFRQHYPQARWRHFRPEDATECAALYALWAKDRRQRCDDVIYLQMLEENQQVHAMLIAHADQLGLEGRVLEIDGTIAGYTFGYAQNPTTFCVTLEIADLSRSGIAAFVFNSFCQDPAVMGYAWINTMDDFGLPNIARVKSAYHPAMRLPIYNIKENL